MYKYVALSVSAILLFGCSGNENQKNKIETVLQSEITCPDDGQRLAKTNICEGRAAHYLNWDGEMAGAAPDGCDWTVNETALPGDEYLLYNALQCNGVKAKLEFAGGAHYAELSTSTSAFFGGENTGQKIVTIATINNNNPQTSILWHAKNVFDGQNFDQCSVHLIEGTQQSFEVDISKQKRTVLAQSDDYMGPEFECGRFGSGDVYSYWRAFGGQLWFFDFGQDVAEFDPASFTTIRKSNSGWEQAE